MDYKDKLLIVFGDSIANGSGNHDFGVGEFLQQSLGFKLKKYAVGGARVGYKQGKHWLVEQVQKSILNKDRPDYVIFNGFTNDCYVPEDGSSDKPDVELGEITEGYEGFDIFSVTKQMTFSRCFEEICHAFKKYFPNAKVLFFRPHNMGRRDAVLQKVYGERAIELCKKWGIAYVDLYEDSGLNTFIPEHRDKYTNDSYGWGKGDSTHPNELGYKEKYMPLIEAKIKTL